MAEMSSGDKAIEADSLRMRIDALRGAMRAAAAKEDFLEAHRLKLEVCGCEKSLQSVCETTFALGKRALEPDASEFTWTKRPCINPASFRRYIRPVDSSDSARKPEEDAMPVDTAVDVTETASDTAAKPLRYMKRWSLEDNEKLERLVELRRRRAFLKTSSPVVLR